MLLVLAVVLPLLITAIGSELILRPTLVSQAATEMGDDAQAHIQAADSLLTARLQNLGSIGHFLAIQRFLSGDPTYREQAFNELALGNRLDANYINWAIFNMDGEVRLAYPTTPAPRGKYMVAPEIIQQLHGVNKTYISDVYFDVQTHMAFIDLYTSITDGQNHQLGIGRSTLGLNELWTAVNNETNAVPGSYAMVIDGHGVRIAYTNPDTTFTTLPPALFKAISPLSPQFQQRIRDEDLYGNSHAQVTAVPDPTLVSKQNDLNSSTTFQFVPALQANAFQAYRVTSKVVPWTYLVLRPVSMITGAANQQDIYLFSLAAVITLLAALVGIVLGRNISQPILNAVLSLTANSQRLNGLAGQEQVMATEQTWIVESSQAGLQAVQYYADASGVAARRLEAIEHELIQKWRMLDQQQVQRLLYELRMTTDYIEKAALHQNRSSQSLSTAIQVTNQVTEQLANNASSAAETANELDKVIEKLRRVVGQ